MPVPARAGTGDVRKQPSKMRIRETIPLYTSCLLYTSPGHIGQDSLLFRSTFGKQQATDLVFLYQLAHLLFRGLVCSGPVSYTHLDVYKRQPAMYGTVEVHSRRMPV